MKILFYKRGLAWPFQSGHDVHTFHMMRALGEAGHHVGLVTSKRIGDEALSALPLQFYQSLESEPDQPAEPIPLRRFEEHFRSYWGVSHGHVRAVETARQRFNADVVVVSGLEVLPLIAGVRNAVRVWYAADEWVLHHLSQVQPLNPESWQNVRDALIKGLYERAFRYRLDRAWAVSDADRTALRWIAGVRDVDVLPNGVDTDHYQPTNTVHAPLSAVFWGRLDFGPNIQALQWFCTRVWPNVRQARPDAQFTIIGFKLGPEVNALRDIPGVIIKPDVPDIRPEIAGQAVVVLPFVSGHGIKNKLLEAAAMGKTVVCTAQALGGTRANGALLRCSSPDEWVSVLGKLWDNAEMRNQQGDAARRWVLEEHTWEAAARTAVIGLEDSLRARKKAS